MNVQTYMLCIKDPDASWTCPEKKGMAALGVAKKVGSAILNGDFICGDSLDVPFMKFIRVQSVAHSIAFSGSEAKSEKSAPYKQGLFEKGVSDDYSMSESGGVPWKEIGGGMKAGWGLADVGSREDDIVGDAAIGAGLALGGGGLAYLREGFKRNAFADVAKPTHGEFVFKKYADNATPQFAFAASAQEPFWLCFFLFRRRIGSGIAGVRLPFFMIGLHKSRVKSWGIDSNLNETVKLRYNSIAWAFIPPLADTNAPGWVPATRWWSTEKPGGGNAGGWALVMAALTAALTAAAGGIAAAAANRGSGDAPF